jgi:uncharacterized protein (TIGR02118 family)
MRVSLSSVLAAGIAAGALACSRPARTTTTDGSTGATRPALMLVADAGSTAATAPAHVVVLYNFPKDTAAFEKYYAATHLPLLNANAKEIGYTRARLVKFTTGLDGKAPMYYRKAEMVWASMDALQKGIATPGFKKVGDDLGNFATGGVVGLIGAETQ